jgi:hypothetical protein
MNLTAKIVILVLLLLLGAGGIYYYNSHNSVLKQTWKKNKSVLGGVPQSCGKFGDVSSCPKSNQPIMVGENSSIYALHSGSVHDPTITERECSLNPPLLCGGREMEYAFEGGHKGCAPYPAVVGGGHELADAYGIGGQARQMMVKGSSCASC